MDGWMDGWMMDGWVDGWRRRRCRPAWNTTVFFLHPDSSCRFLKSPLAVSFTWKLDSDSLGDHNMVWGILEGPGGSSGPDGSETALTATVQASKRPALN